MSKEYIEKAAFRQELINTPFYPRCKTTPDLLTSVQDRLNDTIELLDNFPAADVIEIPETGLGDLSDGYHTFNGLYYQCMILFATLVKLKKECAWKSYRHEDGELCFDGGWFIVGIDTPAGSYTYHYENKYFDLFECKELPAGKHWDGHTEKDVTRLLTLEPADKPVVRGEWIKKMEIRDNGRFKSFTPHWYCPTCGQEYDGAVAATIIKYCFNCGTEMRGKSHE